MRIPPALLALLCLWGCAGRWLEVMEPGGSATRDQYPRDFRVVLRNDSVVTLRDAIVRNDSLVELPSEASAGQAEPGPRGVALSDVVRIDQWQPRGERITGGVVLGVLAILGIVGYFLFRGLSS